MAPYSFHLLTQPWDLPHVSLKDSANKLLAQHKPIHPESEVDPVSAKGRRARRDIQSFGQGKVVRTYN